MIGADGAPSRLRPSDRFLGRGLVFGLLATATLVLPGAAGLDLVPWESPIGPVDSGVAAILLAGVLCFGWPPPDRRSPAASLLDVACGAACVQLYLGAGPGWPPGAGGLASTSAVAMLGAGLAFAGRLGGGPGALSMAALAALVGVAGGTAEETEPGPPLELLPVEVELQGPLTAASLGVEGAPPLELEADLGPGARRSVLAWVPAPVDRAPGAVAPEVLQAAPGPEAAGRVRVRSIPGWTPPADLLDRQRPAAPLEVRARPRPEALLVAWGGLLLLLGIRAGFGARRPVAVGLSCLALASSAAVAVPGPRGGAAGPRPGLRVLEGLVGSEPQWIQVDRGRRGLRVDSRTLGPAWIGLSGPGLARCRQRSTVAGDLLELELRRGAVADLVRPLDPGLRVLEPRVNGWGEFQDLWTMSAAGDWAHAGAWPLGASAPAGRGGGAGTGTGTGAAGTGTAGAAAWAPAWARSGTSGADWALVGALSAAAHRGLEGPAGAAAGSACWLRLVRAGGR